MAVWGQLGVSNTRTRFPENHLNHPVSGILNSGHTDHAGPELERLGLKRKATRDRSGTVFSWDTIFGSHMRPSAKFRNVAPLLISQI